MPEEQVTIKDFYRKMFPNRNSLYTLELDGWAVPVLHGLVVLAARHPEVAVMGDPVRTVIVETREWCNRVMRSWGFTNAQLKYLDTETMVVGKEAGGNGGDKQPDTD